MSNSERDSGEEEMERVAQRHCGWLRVIASGRLERAHVYHCKAFQRRTGTAFPFRLRMVEWLALPTVTEHHPQGRPPVTG